MNVSPGLTRSLTLLSVKETPARRPENQYSFELFSYTSASSPHSLLRPPHSVLLIPHSALRIPYSALRLLSIPTTQYPLLNTHYSILTTQYPLLNSHYLTLIHHPIQQYSRSHSCIQRLCSAIAGNGNRMIANTLDLFTDSM